MRRLKNIFMILIAWGFVINRQKALLLRNGRCFAKEYLFGYDHDIGDARPQKRSYALGNKNVRCHARLAGTLPSSNGHDLVSI